MKLCLVQGSPERNIWGQEVSLVPAGGSSDKACTASLVQSHNNSKGKEKLWVWKQMDEKALLLLLLFVVCKQQAVILKEKKKKSFALLGCEDAAVT